MPQTAFQLIGDRNLRRTLHVWGKRSNGVYKCVLCGGLSLEPSDTADCLRHEPITAAERAMCPKQ